MHGSYFWFFLPKGRAEMALKDKICNMIANSLNVDPNDVVPEAHLIDDLGADSLDVVEIIMSMEEMFDLEISDEDAEKIHTVEDAIDYVKKNT